MADIGIATVVPAFFVGLASFFLSLCILPLVPAFLTFIAGTSISEVKSDPLRARVQIVLNSVAFVLGLAFFFSLLGVLFQSILSTVAYDLQVYLNYFFGAVIIIFGLIMMGLLRIPFLEQEHKMRINPKEKSLVQSFIFGAAFAVGWTPCASPFLGLILGFAATNPLQAFPILFSYSLGLGVPFIVTAFFISRAKDFFKAISPHMARLNFVFGAVFVVLGILIFTAKLSGIVNSLIPQDLALYLADLQSMIFR
ncbi:MAG TPA: cytochrome c biogenesis protein CcdA [archaeon]|nr:cytochrome c biogenesis protein CcdA [archaeon]